MTAASDLVGVPVQPDVLARALSRHEDYRVLRRMQPMRRRAPETRRGDMIVGCALDVETTGLDHRESRIIELAVQRFIVDRHGRIVETGRPRTWLEDPGVQISETVTKLTGLTDADVAGRSISDGEAGSMIASADFVVAHNSQFDRPFIERRLPDAAGRAWVCSMLDFDWRGSGFEGRSLAHLLAQMGWFYEAHRAEMDVTALLHLLDHGLDGGGTVLRELIRHASRPTWRVDAVDAPFSAKELLRGRGYRWNAEKRAWSREVGADEIDEEIEWATLTVYAGLGQPRFGQVTWNERYS